MIKDYSEGKLDKNRIFYRAIIVDVDTEGGKLESRPPNPPNSIRARIYTDGLDANTPDSALTIFYPLFPSHISPPIDTNEHVYVMFEDESKSNGVWVTTVPVHRDVNYGDPELKRLASDVIKSSNVFEGTTPSSNQKTNYDQEFGGLSLENSNRKKIVGVFSSESNSFFKDKKVLLIGDSLGVGSVADSFDRILKEKKIKSFKNESKRNFGTKQWASAKTKGNQKSLIDIVEENEPNIIIFAIGTDDILRSDSYDQQEVRSILSSASSSDNIFWISPPKLSGPNVDKNKKVEQVRNLQYEILNENYIDITTLTGPDGRDSKGIGFVGFSAESLVESIVSIIEQRFI